MGAALAARAELRVSPRPAWLTRGFGAYLVFAMFLLVPTSVYFYVFHGDWFLLYLLDVERVPSAIALIGFVCEAALGAVGYTVAASLVRAQRDRLAVALACLCLAVAAGVVALVRDRLSVVGTFAQYQGGFGLEPFSTGALVQGCFVMGIWLLLGFAYLVFRLYASGRAR